MNYRDIARTSDPQTSLQGAFEVTHSGRRQTHKDQILEVIKSHAGLTRDEIADRLPLRPDQVWRRISDLVNDGEVIYGDARNGQQTVWLNDVPPEQMSLL